MADVTIKLDKFDTAKLAVRTGIDRAVRALAFGVQAAAIDRIRQYPEESRPIDTGALINSIYVETNRSSERSEKLVAAQAEAASPGPGKPPHHSGKAQHLSEAVASGKPGQYEAKVAVCVEYGIYVEMGTFSVRNTSRWSTRKGKTTAQRISDKKFGSYTAPRPFLHPAAEDIRARAEAITAAEVARALKGI